MRGLPDIDQDRLAATLGVAKPEPLRLEPATLRWVKQSLSQLSKLDQDVLRNAFGIGSSQAERFDALWVKRLDEVAAYLRTRGRMPSKNTDDELESTLFRWVNTQRTAASYPSDERVALINERCPRVLKPRVATPWLKRLQQVAREVEKNGSLPVWCSPSKETAKLGMWVKSQRLLFARGQLSDERLAAIQRVCPDMLITQDDEWVAKLEEVAKHFVSHGHLPKVASKDRDEKTLGLWVTRWRSDRAKLTPERLALIAEQCPAVLATPQRQRKSA